MGTVSGLRTRRYHGLLVVAGDIPGRRTMALASLDPIITLRGGAVVRLAAHEWASGSVAPDGHTLLASFELRDGLPRWRWRVGEVVLERILAFQHGTPSLAVAHTLVAGGPIGLAVEPLCTWRDMHGERHAESGLRVEKTADGVLVEDSYRVAGPGFEPDGEWYSGAYHREESSRGLNPTEDLFRPGRFVGALDNGQTLEIHAWAGGPDVLATPPPPAREVITAARRRARTLTRPEDDETTGALTVAADAFIVRTGTGRPDVVAGYPWFGSWSRDTMIAYEGLFLATRRADEGRSLLRAHAETLSEGMLANTADTGHVDHNTADATLWFLHAVDRHLATTGDDDLAAELCAALDRVIAKHREGTRYGIRVDPTDGLLTQGADGYALTWMDAIVHGGPITPRRGKAVELNALWINALGALGGLRERLGRDRADLDRLRDRAVGSFRRRFPSGNGWLYDVIDSPGRGGVDGGADASLRPNQLLAYGLPYAPMRGTDPAPVRAAARTLLTPLGLRTLSPTDPSYLGVHRGDPATRDRAYHQGTVWPWLIGPYADAAAAVGLPTDGILDGLRAHLGEWGVGSVSETADGDPPHAATGCPFQAWSVAETLRIHRRLTDHE